MKAIKRGDAVALRQLIDRGWDVNAPGYGGWTLLMSAVTESQHDCVNVLIDSGADVNASTQFGSTPLMCAANGEDLISARLLVLAGAKDDRIEAEHEAFYRALKPLIECCTLKSAVKAGTSGPEGFGL